MRYSTLFFSLTNCHNCRKWRIAVKKNLGGDSVSMRVVRIIVFLTESGFIYTSTWVCNAAPESIPIYEKAFTTSVQILYLIFSVFHGFPEPPSTFVDSLLMFSMVSVKLRGLRCPGY
jgi:hypothetical protein